MFTAQSFVWPRSSLRRLIRSFILSTCVCLITVSWGTKTFSQIPTFSDGASTAITVPPRNVNRYGALEVTWVESPISGKKLFQVAFPTVLDRSDLNSSQMSVEVRAKNIEDLIWLEISRLRENTISRLLNQAQRTEPIKPRSAQVVISTLKNLPVLQVSNSVNSRPLTIATITPADTDFYSETPEQIAQQWKQALQKEIDGAKRIYSPQFFQERFQETVVTLLGLVLLTSLFGFLRWRLAQKQKALQTQQTSEKDAAAVEQSLSEKEKLSSAGESQHQTHQAKEAESTQALNFFQRQLNLENRLNIYGFMRWFFLWAIILAWYIGVYFLTTRLPILMQWSNRVLTQPLSLMITWFLISFVMRSSRFLIQRSINVWNDSSYLDFGDAQRKVLRSQTIVGALQGLATCVLLVLGLLLTLIQFGLPASSILASSAVIGLALSFGAQNLVKDLVNGCLILLEDQYAVGDIITANGETGFVEKLNLRLTQLRSFDGELISIPNSSISLVKNKTSSWSRVNMGIDVAYSTDLDHAISVIDQVATQMSQDSKWESIILNPPQVLGVDAFGDNSITIRLWIRTEPLQRLPVEREFRRRLKKAFDTEGISIPFPQRSVWFENALPVEGMNKHLPTTSD